MLFGQSGIATTFENLEGFPLGLARTSRGFRHSSFVSITCRASSNTASTPT